MALNSEDKADVKGAMGKAIANKVSKVTKDKNRPKVGSAEHYNAWKAKHSGAEAFKKASSGLATKQIKEYLGQD